MKPHDSRLCFMCQRRPCKALPGGRESALCGAPECASLMAQTVTQGARNAERIGLAPAGFALQVQGTLFPF